MGGITRTIFGGGKSKQKSQSTSSSVAGNSAFDFLKESLGGTLGQTSGANTQLSKLLGLLEPEDRQGAMATFRETPGYQFARDEGLAGVNGSFSGNGMLGSGARDKALLKYGTGLADQTYGQYVDRLFNLGNQGIQAGNVISGAGGFSNSNSQSTGSGSSVDNKGFGAFLGAVLASDPAVKTNIIKLGEFPDGLGIYEYEYTEGHTQWGEGKQIGVMADEVRKFRPWALGPVVDGVQTVDYSKLEGDK